MNAAINEIILVLPRLGHAAGSAVVLENAGGRDHAPVAARKFSGVMMMDFSSLSCPSFDPMIHSTETRVSKPGSACLFPLFAVERRSICHAMIALNGHNLSIPEVWQVATLHVPCELAAEARPLIRRSRQLVESLAAEPRAIYGINTGFGPLSGFRVSDADLAQHQINLLHHLSVGQGALFSAAGNPRHHADARQRTGPRLFGHSRANSSNCCSRR